MKKKLITALVVLALVELVLLAGLWFSRTHIQVDGHFYSKTMEVLDLRGTGASMEQYQRLQQALPECHILWELPFQGNYYSLDTEEISLTALSDQDMALLDNLPRLRTVDATLCQDYDSLMTLKQRRPDLEITYQVSIGRLSVPYDAQALTVEDPDCSELTQKLPYLPQVNQILFTGVLPEMEELLALEQAFPEIHFSWQVCLGEMTLDDTATALSLSGVAVDGEALGQALSRLPHLEQVDALDCNLSDEELRALATQFPEITFLWQTTVAGTPVRTDTQTLDLSGIPMAGTQEIQDALPFLPNLSALILCDCGIDDSSMAQLREQLRGRCQVVWQVYAGNVSVRSDTTTLMPYQFGYTGEPNNELKADQCSGLQYLENMVCMDLGHMEVEDISFVANMPNLEYLLVADTGISDVSPIAGLEKLKFLEIFYNHITDISPLTQCPALEDLNMCMNVVTDITPLLEMKQLKNLWLSGLYLTQEQMDQLREALPDTHIEFYVEGSVGMGWRKLPNYFAQRDMLGMWYLD